MSNPFIPLSVPSLKGNELRYVTKCIEEEWVSSVGEYVDRFEVEIARYLNCEFAIATMNGTAAIHLALILSDIGPDDEVIVPTITFVAPVNAIRYVNAYPVFMDCDDHLNIDIEKTTDFLKHHTIYRNNAVINKHTGRQIRAILPVHIFGHPVDPSLYELAKQYNLPVIEDATESLGSYYTNLDGAKRFSGTIGKFGCLSFNGNKLLTTGGGGMLLTNDPVFAKKAKYLTTQAKDDPLYFVHHEVGYNYRLTNVQAAIGVAQLEQIQYYLDAKKRNFILYQEKLADLESLSLIHEPKWAISNYWYYSLNVTSSPNNRDALMQYLKARKIDSRPLWHPQHLQRPFSACYSHQIEKALVYADQILNIPCSVSLSEQEVESVSDAIHSFYGHD